MKEFDLEKALAGEPVLLRDGRKGVVFYRIPDEYKYPDAEEVEYKLRGMTITKEGCIRDASESWTLEGRYNTDNAYDNNDIIAMWEEPKISIEDLPKPFRPEIGDEFFYLSAGVVKYCSFYSDVNADLMRGGQCFRTEEDAQKWLDFMKSMME